MTTPADPDLDELPEPGSPQDRERVVQQLERVLASATFRRAERSSALLRYLVHAVIDGDGDGLKEYTLGVEALGRGPSFDPRTDPIVRAEASRLRSRLERYYEHEGAADPLVIVLPRGSYVPRFGPRASRDVGAAVPDYAVTSRARWRRSPWAGLFGLAAAMLLAVLWWNRPTPAPAAPDERPLLRVEELLAVDGVVGSDVGSDLALSSDGTRMVFVARGADRRTHLYTRRLDQPSVRRIPGTAGARGPFLSPDGRWVAFWAEGNLKRVPVEGGLPVILLEASDLLGGSWGTDGHIVAALDPSGKLWRIPEGGGAAEAIVDLSPDGAHPRWPQVLPGDQAILYTAMSDAGADQATIEVHTRRTGERKVLVTGGTYGRWLPNGYLTYVNQGTLYAVPFNLDRIAVQGTPTPIIDDVAYSRTFGYAHLDASRTGTFIYRRSAASGEFVAAWLDRGGARTPLISTPGRYNWLSLSPNGQRLAYTAVESGASAVWIQDLATGERRRVTQLPVEYAGLTWLAGSDVILLGSSNGLAWVRPDRRDAEVRLTSGPILQVPWSVTRDGQRLAYAELSSATGFDLWTAELTRAGEGFELGTREPVVQAPFFTTYPAFSPDGKWLLYTSYESGRPEVYVRRFPDDGSSVRVSSDGGRSPRWSPDGRELFYQSEDRFVMVVPVGVRGDVFVAQSPRPWSRHRLGNTGVLPAFDVAADGERVAALMTAAPTSDQPADNHVVFLVNFLAEVARLSGDGGRR